MSKAALHIVTIRYRETDTYMAALATMTSAERETMNALALEDDTFEPEPPNIDPAWSVPCAFAIEADVVNVRQVRQH